MIGAVGVAVAQHRVKQIAPPTRIVREIDARARDLLLVVGEILARYARRLLWPGTKPVSESAERPVLREDAGESVQPFVCDAQ